MPAIIQSTLTPKLKKHVYEAFSKYSIQSTGMDGLAEEPISFEMYEHQKFLGCVVLQMFWGQLHIKYLLVEEQHRGKGHAKTLMNQAFDYGKKRGCQFAFVETLNFQAPEFYQKCGFTTEMISQGYDKGVSFYYMKKEL